MASRTEIEASVSTPIVYKTSKNASETLLMNLDKQHTKPLWTQMTKLNPPLPNPTAIPHVWKYDEIRPHLLQAGEMITEKQAERRVLMLVNSARGEYIHSGTNAFTLATTKFP